MDSILLKIFATVALGFCIFSPLSAFSDFKVNLDESIERVQDKKLGLRERSRHVENLAIVVGDRGTSDQEKQKAASALVLLMDEDLFFVTAVIDKISTTHNSRENFIKIVAKPENTKILDKLKRHSEELISTLISEEGASQFFNRITKELFVSYYVYNTDNDGRSYESDETSFVIKQWVNAIIEMSMEIESFRFSKALLEKIVKPAENSSVWAKLLLVNGDHRGLTSFLTELELNDYKNYAVVSAIAFLEKFDTPETRLKMIGLLNNRKVRTSYADCGPAVRSNCQYLNIEPKLAAAEYLVKRKEKDALIPLIGAFKYTVVHSISSRTAENKTKLARYIQEIAALVPNGDKIVQEQLNAGEDIFTEDYNLQTGESCLVKANIDYLLKFSTALEARPEEPRRSPPPGYRGKY